MRIKNTIITIVFAVILTIAPITASAKVNKAVPRYTTEVAVVGCDSNGDRNLQVFYKNGKIYEFYPNFETIKRFKVGDTVKVHFKTKRTKTVKDDIILDIYKFKNHDRIINQYSKEYKVMYRSLPRM